MRQQMLNEDLYPLVEQLEAESAVKHQLVPDMSLGGGPMANFFMPMIPPGQHEPPPGGSCVGVPQQQNNQQLVPLMQQQPAFGHQQQLVPDMIQDGGAIPNFYMPMVPPGQHEPQPGGSGIGVPEQQNNQQLVPLIQQQMLPYGPMSHLPPGSNIGDVSMRSVSYDIGNVRRLHDVGGISEPANAFPTAQSTMLDENLYPLVEQMDMTEILDWLELHALEVMNTE
ncbi:hypothetical protein M8C21_020032 [Ambrosia artemisiifolia]|uniref:Uncharacterized protein n=1 Tax=Ambrosia artemisiifolia TaxID=4212 RepID=A0AAD5D849_AMBAR|nr:hypothetical protein M8C21_020032 [Ambrosia artemisiifolia]